MKDILVGKLSSQLAQSANLAEYVGLKIVQSKGIKKHVEKRHPECIKYLGNISSIIKHPDYIGRSPNEDSMSFELVKRIDECVQIGIRLDKSEEYFFVATLYVVTEAKVNARIRSGRLKRINDK